MKKMIVFLAICASLTANATQDTVKTAQDTIKIEYQWKEGDSDTYQYKMSAVTAMGDFVMGMKVAQKVTKVYENGDADVLFSSSETKITVNGQEMPGGPQGARSYTIRFNKQGVPVGETQQGGNFAGMFRYIRILSDKPLKVGESINVDYTNPQNTKNTVKGTITLESIEKGMGKFISKFDITTPQTEKPLKLVMTSWIDVATSKLEKAEGTISNLPSSSAGQVDAIQFVVERIKT